MPRLFIVPGLNWARRHTIGRAFITADVSIFNGDLVFAELYKQHPDVNPE
ncbi:MAG TPA: hypothetical protein PLM56_17905 [Cyclobacteriaceae bacterium]|nr:hypothetical protein [Cyclobacteriaceae bacterium]